MRASILVLALAACSKSGDSGVDTDTDADPQSSDTDTDADTDSDTDTDTDTDTDSGDTDSMTKMTADEQAVRDLIAGKRSIDDVFDQVNWGDGFPVRTSTGTYLFVHWYDGGSWSLAGDFDGWSPDPMYQGDGFWWAEVAISSPETQKYKFVDQKNVYWPDPWARSYDYDDNGEFSYVEPPTSSYHLDRYKSFSGEGLQARDLRIYVPPGTGPWPVLYMQDGQNLFDPEAIWGGWQMRENVGTEAAAMGENFLVVGIDNTSDRMSEYTQVDDSVDGYDITAEGDAYAKLVVEDLKPWVESTYGSTGLDGVLGSSLGGLISLYIGFKYPDAFDFVGGMSSTLGWGAYSSGLPTDQEDYLSTGVEPFVVYVDSGGDDGGDGCKDRDGDGIYEDDGNDGDNYCVTRGFADALADHGYTWDENLFHWWEPDATHDEVHWAARVYHPIDLFLTLDD